MKLIKNQKLAARIGILTSIITIAGLLLLWGIVTYNASATVETNLTNQMTDAVKSRAAIINNYVASAEEYMSAFSLSSEVQDLLRDPGDPELISRAQQYTEDFAAIKGIFEGLYIATPETYILTHTSKDAIGIVTRPGDSLAPFQETILAQPELTNLGIMKSPGTGAMILSMYYPIFEDQQCIGYVGAGVFADTLMDSLLELDIQGLPNIEYVFINAETGVYLYHQDEALLDTETTDPGYQEIMRRVQSSGSTQPGTYTYQDENGTEQFVVYQYLADRNWLFMVRDNTKEVYHAVDEIRLTVGLICAAVTTLIILCLIGMMRRVGRNLVTVERAIGRLGQLELEADQGLSSLYDRGDEIGSIARTTHALCERLRLTIDDIGRILGEMADGNIAVLNERLIEQAVLFVIFSDPALNHLGDDLLRLIFALRIVGDLRRKDLLFLIDNLSRNRFRIEIRRINGRDLHRNILRISLKTVFISDIRIESHHNADTAAAMHICDKRAFRECKAADLHILADCQNLVAQLLLNGHIHTNRWQLHQRVNVRRLIGRNRLGAGLDKINKFLILGDKICLRVDLDHNADLSIRIDCRKDNALGSDTTGLFGSGGQTFFTQNFNRLIHVPVRFGQGLFAVHHTAVSTLSERLYIFRSECHAVNLRLS